MSLPLLVRLLQTPVYFPLTFSFGFYRHPFISRLLYFPLTYKLASGFSLTLPPLAAYTIISELI